MNRFVKNKKGITLIALVVTIIILIILTGVTLLLTIGDEGVITRAMNAKIEHDKSVYEEFIMIEVAAEEIAGTKETDIYLKNIQNRLEEKREFEGSNYEIKNGNTLAIKTKEGYKYAVIKGKVIRVEEDSSDKELPVIREGVGQ